MLIPVLIIVHSALMLLLLVLVEFRLCVALRLQILLLFLSQLSLLELSQMAVSGLHGLRLTLALLQKIVVFLGTQPILALQMVVVLLS